MTRAPLERRRAFDDGVARVEDGPRTSRTTTHAVVGGAAVGDGHARRRIPAMLQCRCGDSRVRDGVPMLR